jgi:hypothetical protein
LYKQIIPSKIPHADSGDPGCPGILYGRIVESTGGIICDECFQVIRMVNPLVLQGVLVEMERCLTSSSAASPSVGRDHSLDVGIQDNSHAS